MPCHGLLRQRERTVRAQAICAAIQRATIRQREGGAMHHGGEDEQISQLLHTITNRDERWTDQTSCSE